MNTPSPTLTPDTELSMRSHEEIEQVIKTLPEAAPNRRAQAILMTELRGLKRRIDAHANPNSAEFRSLVNEAQSVQDTLTAAAEAFANAPTTTLRSALTDAVNAAPGEGATYQMRSANTLTAGAGGAIVPTVSQLPSLHDAVASHDGGFLGNVRSIVTPMPPQSEELDIATLLTAADAADVNETDLIGFSDVTFGKLTAAVTKQATLSKTSFELVTDSVADVESMLGQAHRRGHMRRNEAKLWTAATDTVGILTVDGAATFANLMDATTKVLDEGFNATTAVVNSVDLGTIRKALGIDASRLSDALGVTVVVSDAVAAGEALVYDRAHMALVRRDRMDTRFSRGPDFTEDMVYVRTVMRSGAIVLAPKAVCHVAVIV